MPLIFCVHISWWHCNLICWIHSSDLILLKDPLDMNGFFCVKSKLGYCVSSIPVQFRSIGDVNQATTSFFIPFVCFFCKTNWRLPVIFICIIYDELDHRHECCYRLCVCIFLTGGYNDFMLLPFFPLNLYHF